MNRKELRHDRHTVSLLTDHLVFSPKYRGKMLVGDVAMLAEGIMCKTCAEMGIEIIEIAVNPDSCSHILQISSEILPELHCKENKRKYKQDPQKRIPPSQRMVWRAFLGSKL